MQSRPDFQRQHVHKDAGMAQRDHREVAIADTSTMIIRPTIDHLSTSSPRSR